MSVGKVYTFLEYESRLNASKKLYYDLKRAKDEVRRNAK